MSLSSPIWRRRRRGGLLISTAAAAYLASQYNSDYDCLPNLSNLTGDAVFGANLYPTVARIYGGVGYLPGSGANFFSTADSADNSPTTQFEVITRIRANDYTPAAIQTIASKWGGAGARAFDIFQNTTGTLQVNISADGTATSATYTSTIALPATDATFVWVKINFLSSGGNAINFYYAEDTGSNTQPSSWTQLGTQVTGAAVTIFDANFAFQVGAENSVNDFAGQISYLSFSKTIGGAALNIFDFSTVQNYAYGWVGSLGNVMTVSVSAGYQLDWQRKVAPAQLGSAGFYTNARIWGGVAWIPRVSGNSYNAAKAITTTGDEFEYIAYVTLDAFSGSSNMIAHVYGTGLPGRFFVNGSGSLQMLWQTGGNSSVGGSSTSSLASLVGAGQGVWVRGTRQRSGANQNITFYYSRQHPSTAVGSVNWVQLGSVVSTASANPDVAGLGVNIGTDNAGNLFGGSVNRVIVRSSIGGSDVFNFDPSLQADFTLSWTASTGEVWNTTKSTGADTNDPIRLVWNGFNYVYQAGIGNSISTPDNSVLDTVNDIDIVARCYSEWNVGSNASIISQLNLNSKFRFHKSSAGNLLLRYSINGTTENAYQSTVTLTSVGVANKSWCWVRVVRNATTNQIFFYYSTQQTLNKGEVVWTQLGTTISGAVAGTLFNSTAEIWIGGNANTADPFTGGITYVDVATSIGGSPVLRFDASLCGINGYTDPIASNVWTINRASNGFKNVFVTQTTLLTGSDDQLQVNHHPLLNRNTGQNFTVMGMFRQYTLPSNFGRLIEKATSNANNGYQLVNNGTALQNYTGYDGAGTTPAAIASNTYASGDLISHGLVIEDTLLYGIGPTTARTGTTATAGDGMTTTSNFFISASTGRVQVEYYGHAVIPSALTDGQLTQLRTELLR